MDWTAQADLWIDKIRVHDEDRRPGGTVARERGRRLFAGDYNNHPIGNALGGYDNMTAPSPWRFYLYGEPRFELNESVGYVNNLIKAAHGGRSGVVAVNLRANDPRDHQQLLRDYVDTVQPSELLVDYYTFGRSAPAAGATTYPERLNRLAYWYGNARAVALEKSIPLWVCVQGHSWRQPARRDTRRDPGSGLPCPWRMARRGFTTSWFPVS